VTDRIPSDHDAVESHRAHLDGIGRTRRLQLPLPSALSCSVDDVVSVSFDGGVHYAQITRTLDGDPAIRGAFPDRQLARTGDADNEFRAWLQAVGLSPGDPIVVDVLTDGHDYGLRLPGDRVVYEPPGEPDSSLAAIARGLDPAE